MVNSERDTILIGDHVTLRFRSKIDKGDKFIFQEPSNPLTAGIEMLQPPITDTLSIGDDGFELESRIVITSFESGSYKLPTFTAYRIKNNGSVDTLSFDGGELEVNTIQIDTTTYKPFDVKEQMNYPFTLKEALPWAGILIIVTLLVYMLLRAIKSLRHRKGLFGPAPTEPPHIIALKRLEKLRNDKIWTKDQKLFFTELTDTLRDYIESRYDFPAMEKTSAEILSELSARDVPAELKKELSSLFSLSDLVKFAKFSAETADCENSIPAAVRFINTVYVSQIEDSNNNNQKNNGGI
jgi:hypothetical protein